MSAFSTETVHVDISVVIERGPTSWGAFVPAAPEVFAVGATRDEVLALVAEALAFHFETLHEEHAPAAIAEAEAAAAALADRGVA